jgi:hypothetical protein
MKLRRREDGSTEADFAEIIQREKWSDIVKILQPHKSQVPASQKPSAKIKG